ncbi:hypothetical protein BH11BAC6_BH11BAC6_08960 [soil metagenome]
MVFYVITIVSCKKELTGSNLVSEASVSSQNEDNATTAKPLVILNHQTKFGSIINGAFTPTQKVSIAKSLNAGYVRSGITVTEWTGKSGPYENYVNNGIKVVLNINNDAQTGNPKPFPKDMISYRNIFTQIVNKYQPEVIVVENEEINPNYHSGPMADYLNMLTVALDVCHAKGIKVANGGIYGSALEILTYRYLQTKGQNRADSFGNNCMTTYQVKAAQTPNSNPTLEKDVRQMDTLMNFYVNLDYVNIHMYEPFDPDVTQPELVTTRTPIVIADIQEFLKVRTGKPTMTNETGQRNNRTPGLVVTMLAEYDRLLFPYAIWFSDEDAQAGATSLYNMTTGVLGTNGLAFAAFMAAY